MVDGRPGRQPRLLFVAPWFLLPADTGGKIRTGDVLRGLKGGRFEIVLASPAPADLAGHGRALDELCDRFAGWPEAPRGGAAFALSRVLGLASRLPVAVASDRSAAGRRLVAAELARRPDVAVIDFAHTAVLAPERLPVPSVLFTHNVEAEIFRRHAGAARGPLRRWLWRNQAAKMERFEGDALGRFDAVVAVSERDRAAFRERYGAANVATIPTGVDLGRFPFSPPPGGDDGTVAFTGSMDWPANADALVWFMDEVWPRIVAARPGARFVAVGRNPPARLVREAARRGLGWSFTGFVEDVRPPVRAARVSVVPLRVGGGTRIKVYEAMALGRPVVSTAVGVEGLPVEPGRHFLLADRADDFAAAVVHLLDDDGAAVDLAAAARAFVERHASSLAVARAFEEICARAAGLG